MSTKERLFEIALNLFSEKGFNATSIRAITHEAGVSIASFYNHFDSKDELLRQMYAYYLSQYITGKVVQISEELLDALGPVKLFQMIGESLAQSMKNEKLVRLSRIIMLEQYTNQTARAITINDKKMLLDATEQLFILMKNKKLIEVDDPATIGKIIGYAYLGFASDNANYSLVEGEDPEARILAQTKVVLDYIKSILKEPS
ncbi:MAG: TetR/AcrR family transcriptional regulator [Clostridiaceae bacterium]|jgi:AcrR family transcriptional regulator|nr:TetR/AcrR family transcriptional regulator [Clostridiaceae bacterium]